MIDYITPLFVKNVIVWLNDTVTPILSILFNIIVCICPCIEKIIRWTLTKLKHLIGRFGMTYTPINDEYVDDETEFNWWTKYYGSIYQKVVKCLSKYDSYDNNTLIGL